MNVADWNAGQGKLPKKTHFSLSRYTILENGNESKSQYKSFNPSLVPSVSHFR